MYFVSTNAVETIVGVGVVSPPSQKMLIIFVVELLMCIFDFITHIHMYFVRQIHS